MDKTSGDILQMGDINGYPAAHDQADPSGEKLTYSTYRAFGDIASAPFVAQYLAARTAQGWTNRGISPPRGTTPILQGGNTLQTNFRAFSADLCQGWLLHDVDPVLAPGAVEGYANFYRDDLCGEGGYQALTTVAPPKLAPNLYIPELQGVSADGAKAVFVVNEKLTPQAAEVNTRQLYEASEGEVRLLSVLPNGSPCTQGASAGTETSEAGNGIKTNDVEHALAADGSRVYWTCGSSNATLYVRLEGEAKSRLVGSGRFWTAAPDGSKALYSAGGELKIYDAEAKSSTTIAPAENVVETGDDLSRIYFLSATVFSGEEESSHGDKAKAGGSNLYLYEEGEVRFIATLADADSSDPIASVVADRPVTHAAGATSDGAHLAFMSHASLSGYDNTDAISEKAAAEVYLYDAEQGSLRCASCNPTGARPAGRDLDKRVSESWVAAKLPLPNSQLYFPRYLSEDGSRLFFESFEALVPRDANGVADVYEFEPGDQSTCEASGATIFAPEAEGCLSLISSGESPADSRLIDVSTDGRDVFFATGSSLLPQDNGLVDIYDARAGGGFPQPPTPPAQCEGEACQGAPAPPNDPTPASSAFHGAGNVTPVKAKKKSKKQKKRKKHTGKNHTHKKQGRTVR